jgi:predicted amidohydrolase
VLFLPEASDYIAHSAEESLALAQPQTRSEFVQGLCAAAKRHGVAVHVGIHEPLPTTAKLLNRALYISAAGDVVDAASYDKLHVFDYGSLRESDTVQAGGRLTAPFDSPVGRIGSLICFDLRFAEPAISLAQPGPGSPWHAAPAQVLTYPSAFTLRTGQAHWETLLRARAVETQSWVVAAAQVGWHNDKRASYGRSMVVDPWGEVRVRLGGTRADGGEPEDGAVEEIGFVDVDVALWDKVRREMPLRRR